MNEIFATYLVMVFRLLISCFCGIAIGFERKNRAKEAGIRTHCIVACASAMMMIISKYGFNDMIEGSIFPAADVRLDPSRMAQGIVTGVGFLGAGIIYIQRGAIKGLTTAAGIWATSGIGMAIGAGQYVLGIATTIIVLIAQIVFHFNSRFIPMYKGRTLKVYNIEQEGFQEYAEERLESMHIMITDVSIIQNGENTFDYIFCLEMPKDMREEVLIRMFRCERRIDVTY